MANVRDKELKVKLSENEFEQFNQACNEDNVLPSSKARELIVSYSRLKLSSAPQYALMPDDNGMPKLIQNRPLRVGEMFSGPGGIGTALNRAKSEHFSFEHVWATDWDPDTCRTYQQKCA